MRYVLSEEQASLRASLRRFLEQYNDEGAVRRLMETAEGYDAEVWTRMATQLGLQGIQIPEQYGGTGLGHRELAVTLEEMGRVLYSGPFFATAVLAVNTLLTAGDTAACEDYLPGIASGELLATVAFTEQHGQWDPEHTTVQARPDGPAHRLDGTKSFVLDGHIARLVLVLARDEHGPGIFAVRTDELEEGELVCEPLTTLDPTRRQARLHFRGTAAHRVGEPGSGARTMRTVMALAATALAAEQLGGAQACLDMAVAYARDRFQFGRPIGSFQAIKHKCATVSLRLEEARSASLYASWCAAESDDELLEEASVAKAACSDTFMFAASENLQIHGGIGFTWEHPAHLYLRRAKSTELFLGDARHHREQLIRHVGL